MRRVFKKHQEPKVKPPTTGEAIGKLREMEEMLTKKQEYLESKVNSETALARQHAKSGNRATALKALKRKKRYEQQLASLDGTLTTIEQQRVALEGANTNTAVLTAMGHAAKALKGANANMDGDKVHDMMDDIAEQFDLAKDISEAISNPVAFGEEFDEDELEEEFRMLEDELGEEEEFELPSMPNVPTRDPKVKSTVRAKEEDDDMAQLAAWAV